VVNDVLVIMVHNHVSFVVNIVIIVMVDVLFLVVIDKVLIRVNSVLFEEMRVDKGVMHGRNFN